MSKKFVRFGSHTIYQSLKKRFRTCRGRKKCSKKPIAELRYTSMTGDKSWSYAYEPASIQRSTVWVFQDEPNPTKVALLQSTSKQMIAWTCRNRSTRTTQNSQFWAVHNHLFGSCFPRNQENQPPKTNHYSYASYWSTILLRCCLL